MKRPFILQIGWILLAAVMSLTGCSQATPKPHSFSSRYVISSHGQIYVDKRVIDEIKRIYGQLTAASQETPELVFVGDVSPNAYALLASDKYKIALSIGMIDLLEDRWGEYAFVLAHELSHVKLDHVRDRSRQKRRNASGSDVVGVALSLMGMPLGVLAADTGTYLIDLKYSRDQERLADEQALRALSKSQYSLDSAVAFHRRLEDASKESPTTFLSTHPSGNERIENTIRFIKLLKTPPTKSTNE